MSSNNGLSALATGLFQVDEVERRSGSNYELSLQFASLVSSNPEDPPVNEGKAMVWVEAPQEPPKVNSVIWATANFIPTASCFLGIDEFTTIFEEDAVPEAFEPRPPTVIVIGRVIAIDQTRNFFKVVVEEYDRRVGRRTAHELGIYRSGKRWDKAPWPRDGAVVKVRGTYYNQQPATNLHTIAATSIDFLPWATASAPNSPSPAKRRFVKGGPSKRPAPEDDDGAGPSSPSAGRSTRGNHGKGKNRATDDNTEA